MNRNWKHLMAGTCFLMAPLVARADDKPPKANAPKADAKSAPPAEKLPGPLAAPKPAAEVDELQYLTGNFNCEGARPRIAGAPELKYKARFVSKLALDKYFVAYQHTQTKAKDLPAPSVREGHIGWDLGLKRYLLGSADNGGIQLLLRAEAPTSDQMIFKGTASAWAGRHVPVLWTFTKTEKGFDLHAEATDPDGQLVTQIKETCLRSAK